MSVVLLLRVVCVLVHHQPSSYQGDCGLYIFSIFQGRILFLGKKSDCKCEKLCIAHVPLLLPPDVNDNLCLIQRRIVYTELLALTWIQGIVAREVDLGWVGENYSYYIKIQSITDI